MSNNATGSNAISDAMKSVASGIENAAGAACQGANDAASKVKNAVPAAGRFVSRFVYSTFYFASYGLTFPTLFVANVVPGMGSIADGLTDGARAACDVIDDIKSKRAAQKASASDPESGEVASNAVETLANV